jgi:hypothetical protein
MAFTRFHDDPVRIQKQLQESTYLGRYQLNTPGPGIHLPFMEDPHVRLQKWGANLQNNTVDLESSLRSLNRPLNRDLIQENNYKNHGAKLAESKLPYGGYSIMQPYVEQSRASQPAWMYKELEQSKWEIPLINPQSLSHLETPFQKDLSTRLLERDYYVPRNV